MSKDEIVQIGDWEDWDHFCINIDNVDVTTLLYINYMLKINNHKEYITI